MRKFKGTKEELEETKGEKFKKKIFKFFIIELNLFLALVSGQAGYTAGYPVSGKIPVARYPAKSVSDATLLNCQEIIW